jgi:hypothetical protein
MVIKKNLDGYNGNPNLKKPRKKIEFTAYQIEEYVKCESDPIYFAENYIKIVTLDHGLVPITLYDFQKEIIETSQTSRNVAVCTSRQVGKTTTAVCLLLHYVIFNSFKTVAILAHKKDGATEVLTRIKQAYEALPDFLQQGILKYNEGDISLENGCKIISGSSSSGTLRGKAVNYLYGDEAAFIPNFDEWMRAVFPTLSSGKETRILLTSTPNGLNSFYHICEGGKNKTNGYAYIEVKWDRIPGRDKEWYKNTIATLNNDLEAFQVEYCCEFQGSSGTLISGTVLKALKSINPITNVNSIKQFIMPEKDRKYTVLCDVSEGVGLDSSAFQVIDITDMPYKQVCSFKDNLITPQDYASTIYNISRVYNDASILVETNNVGDTVAHILYNDYECETLIMTETAGKAGQRITSGMGKAGSVRKGIKTTKTTKTVGCSVLKLLVEQKQLLLNDQDTLDELYRFSRDGETYAAEEGAHDDLVMGLVLFAWMSNQKYFKELTEINTMFNLRQNTDENIITSLLNFVSIDSNFYQNPYESVPDTVQPINFNDMSYEDLLENKEYFNF